MTSSERLIEAAGELLQRDGFTGMSPAAVQRRAGVGQGSMYHHFRGKADLARAATERNVGRLLAAADRDLAGAGDPVERVCRYLRRERDPMLGCPVGRLAQDRGVVEDPGLRAVVGELFTRLESRIADTFAQDPSITKPDEVAAATVAILQGGYVLARASGDRAAFDRAIDGAVHLLTASNKGEPR